MIYNEAYEARRQMEEALVKKWEKALKVNGISDEHMARTTAILLENYMTHLQDNPSLIAEDQVQTSAFTGVNLALLGLIARAIPQLTGLELVGTQAMPTPTSPIFTLRWYKSNLKGQTAANEEMWVSPIPSQYPVGIDPYYTSSEVRGESVGTLPAGLTLACAGWLNAVNPRGYTPLLFTGTMYLNLFSAAGALLARYKFGTTDLNSAGTASGTAITGDVVYNGTTYTLAAVDAGTLTMVMSASGTQIVRTLTSTVTNLNAFAVGGVTATTMTLDYDYKPEDESMIPEIEFEIAQESIGLTRRQLRGSFTLDAAYDLKKLHGIDLESAIMDMMKQELMAEINREIINDLRMMAGITKTIDLTKLPTAGGTQVSIAANYDDAQKAILDAIEKVCAEIWNIGRRGFGNFVVGNPATLSFLDRVPGFVGSGVTYSGRDLAFQGSLGGKIKFYSDPQFPKNELLIGYKGTSAIDSGYLYCPYLPITATPTLIDPNTGNPKKLYYTRYGKTFKDRGDGGKAKNYILMGEYQYARLIINGLPAIFQ